MKEEWKTAGMEGQRAEEFTAITERILKEGRSLPMASRRETSRGGMAANGVGA